MSGNSRLETLPSWCTLYKSALAETDVQKLPLRIEEARRALILRSRELFVLCRSDPATFLNMLVGSAPVDVPWINPILTDLRRFRFRKPSACPPVVSSYAQAWL